MFQQIKVHRKVISGSGKEYEPVATLREKGIERLCHIVIDDESYMVLLEDPMFGLVPTYWIFPEVHAVLKTLPPPAEIHSEDNYGSFTDD